MLNQLNIELKYTMSCDKSTHFDNSHSFPKFADNTTIYMKSVWSYGNSTHFDNSHEFVYGNGTWLRTDKPCTQSSYQWRGVCVKINWTTTNLAQDTLCQVNTQKPNLFSKLLRDTSFELMPFMTLLTCSMGLPATLLTWEHLPVKISLGTSSQFWIWHWKLIVVTYELAVQ